MLEKHQLATSKTFSEIGYCQSGFLRINKSVRHISKLFVTRKIAEACQVMSPKTMGILVV
jgi:hypothetical protein